MYWRASLSDRRILRNRKNAETLTGSSPRHLLPCVPFRPPIALTGSRRNRMNARLEAAGAGGFFGSVPPPRGRRGRMSRGR